MIFDDTLFHKSKFPGVGMPIDGAISAVWKLKNAGHHITIFSTRANSIINSAETRNLLMSAMKNALHKYMIPYDVIAEDKPAWDILIDDRCIRFPSRKTAGQICPGTWNDVLEEIDEFEPVDWSPCDGITDSSFNGKK